MMANGRTGVFANPLSPRVSKTERMIGMKTRGNPSGPEALKASPQAEYMGATALLTTLASEGKKLANRRSPYMG
jgi:hypothetical protein